MSKPAATVTFTVTVEMTEAQCDKYRRAFGIEGVSLEVANRVRPTVDEAIRSSEGWLRWLAGNSTITISKPQPGGTG